MKHDKSDFLGTLATHVCGNLQTPFKRQTDGVNSKKQMLHSDPHHSQIHTNTHTYAGIQEVKQEWCNRVWIIQDPLPKSFVDFKFKAVTWDFELSFLLLTMQVKSQEELYTTPRLEMFAHSLTHSLSPASSDSNFFFRRKIPIQIEAQSPCTESIRLSF